ncbi:iron-containing alcohol dehydrogenase [Variovorax sp. YR216]|uniref:iron-containing alcohol dehydrogenase n=1 Tax=Variovorax sp. YR216 TaxID=1882828 RepID=UPI00210AC899|nr:iron-containing alcohol dehydrogenase [Variovorax sp. YR216]
MNALHLPRTVFGAGAIGQLAAELVALGVRRPLVVADKGIVAAGIAQRVVRACGESAAPVLFDAVTENPLFADADAGAGCYAAQGCDGVVAVGGGSVIDTAKLIALLAANPGRVADYVGANASRHGAAAPLAAIPTTAGTGSEASPSAGLHPDATTPSVGINSRHLVPRLAVLDPELTVSLPPWLTAATGIDALSHCIEGCLSERDQPLGKAIALDGIARVARHLRRAVDAGADANARAEMMLAAFAGGVSIGMGLGPAHAIALTCSDQGFRHGVLSGIGLVATLDATAVHVSARMAAINDALGLPASVSTAQAVRGLMRDLGLPGSLAELGYAAGDLQALAQAAARSHFNLSAPFKPDAEAYAGFFRQSLGLGADVAGVSP